MQYGNGKTNRTSLVNTAEQEQQKHINTTHTPSLPQAHSIRTNEKQKIGSKAKEISEQN